MSFACSVCNEEFEDKCILHCEKDDWYQVDENDKKIWENDKVDLFWSIFHSQIDTSLTEDEYTLSNVFFPKFQDTTMHNIIQVPNKFPLLIENVFYNKLHVSFDNCTFLDDANFKKYVFQNPLLFYKCTFEKNIQFNNIYKDRVYFLTCTINNLNCKDIVFEQKVKIQYCSIKGEANFYNTKFKELADFYRTTFNEVIFERTDFENISVFSEAEFNKDVDFKYTKFLGKSIFRDTVIKGKLNLRDTIFDDEATFLDITSEKRKKNDNKDFYGEPKVIQVSNRETARVIKNFYDKSNNIIEANKFYALEMKERRKELDAKSGFVEWIVFYLHEVSSNHSQSWLTALLWIVLLAFFYTMEINGIPLLTFFITFLTINVMIEYFFKKYTSFIRWYNKIQPYILILFYMPYIFIIHVGEIPYFMSLAFLNEIAKNINLFSKLNLENITLGLLVYKIVLSYLMYQFVVAVRQNTRRK